MNDELLNPSEYYNKTLKQQYADNTKKYFDELVKQSGMNVKENQDSVKQYDSLVFKCKNASSKYRKMVFLFIFLLIISIVVFVFSVLAIIKSFLDKKGANAFVILFFVLAAVGVVLFVLDFVVVKKKKLERKKELSKLEKQRDDQLALCYHQMRSLNGLFDWNIPSEIIKRTTPLIQLDPYLDTKKFEFLYSKYGFQDNNNKDISTVLTLTGEIVGNPFFLYRLYSTSMYLKRYTGSLVISWTERVSDGKGGSRLVTRTQTLYAHVDKPAPGYYLNTSLMYANEAAPDLTFSRKPSGATGLDDKHIEKMVRKGKKVIDKKVRNDLLDKDPSTNFTAMGNEKFDVLFGALDRDNEVQFRLLFTPLAQSSMIKLIRNPIPFGDDFVFKKRGCLNYITSNHSQNFNYSASPNLYSSYSHDISEKKFFDYNTSFIKNLFFDLAPLLCVPLYQQHKPFEYIYKDIFKANYTTFESEVMANAFDSEIFRPKGTITNQILKVVGRKRVGNSDVTTICSHSYKGIDRIDYIPVYGGDHCYHNVPVHWVEYIPASKETDILVKKVPQTRSAIDSLLNSSDALNSIIKKYGSNFVYQRGLMAMLLNKVYDIKDEEALDNIFNN